MKLFIFFASLGLLNADSKQYTFTFNSANEVTTAKTAVQHDVLDLSVPWSKYRLISLREGHAEQMEENQVDVLSAMNIKFMDITDDILLRSGNQVPPPVSPLPTDPKLQHLVKPHFEKISPEQIKKTLEEFSSFHNRHYKSKYGVESAEWLYKQVEQIASTADASRYKIKISKVSHAWSQFSVVARIEAVGNTGKEVTIISAHQDSTAGFQPIQSRAPGADDNGSGSMSIMEIFRVLISSNKIVPHGFLEFHWYAAEEAGLLGSKHVAAYYLQQNVPVKAVFHLDMDGYVGSNPEVIGVITDYTNPELTNFIRKCIKEYLRIPAVDTKCGYACSDHASWTQKGYRSVFNIETEFKKSNPHIHSANDTVDKLDFNHAARFAELGLAFAFELCHNPDARS